MKYFWIIMLGILWLVWTICAIKDLIKGLLLYKDDVDDIFDIPDYLQAVYITSEHFVWWSMIHIGALFVYSLVIFFLDR